MIRILTQRLGPWPLMAVATVVVLACAGRASAVGNPTDASQNGGGVSFRNEVMAVFAKAGCSAGACHGNRSGKGGFKLSLRGQEPDVDFLTLTRDQFGRRVNTVDPAGSLLLRKATAVVPHEGGRRFSRESD